MMNGTGMAHRDGPSGVSRRVDTDVEIFLIGVEEPCCLIHAPNESGDPSEIEHLAIAEALLLQKHATVRR